MAAISVVGVTLVVVQFELFFFFGGVGRVRPYFSGRRAEKEVLAGLNLTNGRFWNYDNARRLRTVTIGYLARVRR